MRILLVVLFSLGAAGACEERGRQSAAKEGPGVESARESAATMSREGQACDAQRSPDRRPCRRACARGHSNSCARLGNYWAGGEGGEKHEARARELWRRACDGGSGLGCAALARREGEESALRLWKRARRFCRVHCEQGHQRSCAALGNMFVDGRGGAADRGAARHYLQRACDLGGTEVCRDLRRLQGP